MDGQAVVAGRQWALRCPVHRAGRCLSLGLGTRGRRFVWQCHHDPACTERQIHAAMLALGVDAACIPLPGKSSQVRRTVPAEDLVALASHDLPKTALRLAILQLAGVSPREARERLKLRESTYYDALRALSVLRISGEQRRST